MGSNARGSGFEYMVHALLMALHDQHPDAVVVKAQDPMTLHDGRRVFPDFELRVQLPHKEDAYLIECQDRERSSHGIVDKIRAMRSLSSRNKFIFVHGSPISAATENSLDSDGVMRMTFEQFGAFLIRTDQLLDALHRFRPAEVRSRLEDMMPPNFTLGDHDRGSC